MSTHARAALTYFLGRCGYSCSLEVQRDAAQRPLVGRDVHWGFLRVGEVYDLHVARMSARERQQRVVAVGTQHAQTWKVQHEGGEV